MSAKRLSSEQVTAWQLNRQGVLRRGGKEGWLDTVRRIGGIPAYSAQAVELAVWTRADGVRPDDVRHALREERTLTKTWAMRGAPYVLPSAELPQTLAALRANAAADGGRKTVALPKSRERAEAVIAAIGNVLGKEPLTLERLAGAVAEHSGREELGGLLLADSAELLRTAAREGLLCFGPSEGEHDTFVRPDQWIRRWIEPSQSPEATMSEAARRYLSVYGPAAYEDFGKWWGLDSSRAKRVLRSLESDIAAVTVEGRECWALRSTIDELHAASVPEGTVRLLPLGDPFTVSVAHRSHRLLPEPLRPRVYRSEGPASPVVLVDGRFAGVWSLETKRSQTELKAEWFEPSKIQPSIKKALEEEAARLVDFYETDIILRC